MHRKKIVAMLLAGTMLVTSVGAAPVFAEEAPANVGSSDESGAASANTTLSLAVAGLNGNQGAEGKAAKGETELSLQVAKLTDNQGSGSKSAAGSTDLTLQVAKLADNQGSANKEAAGKTTLTLVIKDHKWTYKAKDNTITVSCDGSDGDGCEYKGDDHALKLTLDAKDAAYSGAAYSSAKVEMNENFADVTGATVGKITYYKAAGEGSTETTGKEIEAPTAVGNYVAVCTVTTKDKEELTAKAAFAISYEIITGEGFSFNPEDGHLEITSDAGFGAFKDSEIYKNDKSALKEVTIKGVTAVPDDAFQGCTSLKDVFIESGVESIGSSAFEGCSALEEVIIPETVTSIGAYAFYGCENLATVKAQGTTPPTIGTGVFDNTKFVTDGKEGQGIKVRKNSVDSYKTSWSDWAKYIEGYELHTHTLEYTVTDNVITVSCTNEKEQDECVIHNHEGNVLTCILNAEDAEYDGEAHEASVDDGISGELGLAAPVIEYYRDGEKLDSAPVNAGTYEARITVAGKTAVKAFTIAPKKAELAWTADTEFTYNGEIHGVTAEITNGIGEDTFELTYEENQESKAGTYTAKVTGLGNSNYTLEGVDNVTNEWSIRYLEVSGDDLPTLTGTSNENGWYTGNVTLTPKDGYMVSSDGTSWKNSLAVTEDGTYEFTYYLKDAAGNITDKQTISVKKDTVAPDGEIKVGNNAFKGFLNKITFGYFFKNTVDVTITATDAVSGVAEIRYQKVAKDGTFDANGEWTVAKDGKFSMKANDKSVVYARLTDNAGNAKIINSDGIVVYTDATASDSVAYTRRSNADVTSAIALNGNTVKAVKEGDNTLKEGTDYAVTDGRIVLKAAYLETLAAGTHSLTVSYNPNGEAFTDESKGTDAADSTITVTVARISADSAETQITNTDKLSKTYDGSVAETPEASSKNGSEPTIEYKKKGAADDTYTTAEPKDAGTYVVRVTYPADADYDTTTATAEFTIAQVPVTVTVSDATKHIGKDDPAFSYEITDGALVGEDTLGDISYTREAGETAGTYAIHAAKSASTNANYDITFADGTLTITDHVKAQTPVKENEKAPTCTEAGSYDEVYYCTVDDCGIELERTTKTIDALGHNYGDPAFTWSEDYKTASAAFTCANDASHVENVDATVTSETTKAATCTEAGTLTYTAAVKFGGETYTDTKTAEIPATGHAYADPAFTWSDDYKTATVKLTCEHDASHVVEEACEVTETPETATCEKGGKALFTARVTVDGQTYTDQKEAEVPALGHNYGEPVFTWNDDHSTASAVFICANDNSHTEKVKATVTTETTEATCETAGKTVSTATVEFGGKTYTDTKTTEIAATGHNYGEPAFTWNEDNTASAAFTCANDASHVENVDATVTSETTKAATCTEAGTLTYTATVKFGDKTYTDTKNAEIAATGHDWSGDWTVVKEATETEAGKRVKECANKCGQKKYEVIPAAGSQEEPVDPNAGTLEKDAEVSDDAPVQEVTMGNSRSELLSADKIFTEEEKDAIASGTDARVWLEISATNMDNLSKEEQAKISEAIATLPGVSEEITYFDADLFKQVTGFDKAQIKEPGTAIKVTVKIPDNLRNKNEKINREYKIIRLHNGEAEVLNGTFDEATGEFAFETDKFSTYAIVYTDTEKKADDNNKPSGDDTNKPSDDSNKPTGDNTNKPSDDSNKPTGDNTNKPSNDGNKPTGDNTNKPSNDSNKPTGDNTNKPSDNSNKPSGDNTNKPSDDSNNNSNKPSNDSNKPTGDNTNKPSDDNNKPTGDNSNKPTADNNPLVEANKPSDNNTTANTALKPADSSKETKNVSSEDTGDYSGIEWFFALIPAGAFLYVAGRRRKKNEA